MLDKSKVRIPEKFKDHPIFNELICGTNFGFMSRYGYYFTDFAKKQPDAMKEMGVNWTTLNLNICQEKVFSRKLFLDFEFSSSEAEIAETTKKLHENGIRVILKPCLTCLDGGAMGAVNFPDRGGLSQIQGVETDYWGEWFDSYTKCLIYCADMAERYNIESLMIGAELYYTIPHGKHWRNVIKAVREHYSGPISYEFTPSTSVNEIPDWFKELDYLSYSYYPAAAPRNEGYVDATTNIGIKDLPDVTVEEMIEYLKPCNEGLTKICEKCDNMPIAFTEIGVRSSHGGIILPWEFLWDSYYDGEMQANYMEAVFTTFFDNPYWMGLFWWKWDETQNRPHYHTDPNGDMGFTIQGKPAEAVMRRWFAKNK